MLKPLIQAIPSKKINIHNREYLVYEPISQCGEFIRFYQDERKAPDLSFACLA